MPSGAGFNASGFERAVGVYTEHLIHSRGENIPLRALKVTLEQARAAKETAKVLLATLPGVVGVGITKMGEDYALKVNVRAPLQAGVSVPERIAGVPVCVEVVGRITKRG